MDTINIPLKEYEALKEEVSLLKDKELLKKVNRLIDLLFEEKYGLYMGDYTEDLSEIVMDANYKDKKSAWDRI